MLGHFLEKPYHVLGGEPGALETSRKHGCIIWRSHSSAFISAEGAASMRYICLSRRPNRKQKTENKTKTTQTPTPAKQKNRTPQRQIPLQHQPGETKNPVKHAPNYCKTSLGCMGRLRNTEKQCMGSECSQDQAGSISMVASKYLEAVDTFPPAYLPCHPCQNLCYARWADCVGCGADSQGRKL